MSETSRHCSKPQVPIIRAANLMGFIDFLEKTAGPADGCLGRAGLSRELTKRPECLISFPRAIRFLELASAQIGTPHMGWYVGRDHPISALGSYGQRLDACVTVHDYLRTGVSLYPRVSNRDSLKLEEVREGLRIHHDSGLPPSLGTHQSDLHFIEITLGKLREALGPSWTPGRVGIAHSPSEPVPADSLLASAGVLTKSGTAFIEVSKAELRAVFPRRRRPTNSRPPSVSLSSLPADFVGLARAQIEMLLPTGRIGIELLAESMGLSVRSVQRRIASAESSFSELLEDARFRLATSWLEHTSKSITEIAFDLGYQYPANFTRAFRARTGLPPNAYRATFSGSA